MTTIDQHRIPERAAPPRAERAPAARWLWLEAFVVGSMALAVRLAHLDHPPHFDELYHVLAARGWLEIGAFAIAEGAYTRAWHFTLLVAGAIASFGESLSAARVPGVLFGTLWVLAVFLWTRRYAGRTTGLLAGLFFAFDPGAINLSQLVRFYSLHGLAFWVFVVSVFALTQRLENRSPRGGAGHGEGVFVPLPPLGRRGAASTVALLVAAAAAGALAFSLQITTLIGAAGLAVWAAARYGPELLRRARHEPDARRIAVGLAAMVALLAAAFVLTGAAGAIWSEYRSVALWAAGNRDNVLWYHRWLTERFAAFWALFPVAALVAVHRFRAAAGLCVVVFAVALVLHSGAGFKAERYFYYAMPFFLIVWAMTLAVMIPEIRRLAADVISRFAPARTAKPFASAAVGAVLLFALYGAPVNYVARRMVFPDGGWRPYSEPDWAAAAEVLEPMADSAGVVVSAALPKALYFLGRADVALGVSELTELRAHGVTPREFAIDPRTGRPSIGSPASLTRLMNDYPSGLVLVERQQWQRDCCVTPAAADVLLTRAEAVELPEDWGLLALRWRR